VLGGNAARKKPGGGGQKNERICQKNGKSILAGHPLVSTGGEGKCPLKKKTVTNEAPRNRDGTTAGERGGGCRKSIKKLVLEYRNSQRLHQDGKMAGSERESENKNPVKPQISLAGETGGRGAGRERGKRGGN